MSVSIANLLPKSVKSEKKVRYIEVKMKYISGYYILHNIQYNTKTQGNGSRFNREITHSCIEILNKDLPEYNTC